MTVIIIMFLSSSWWSLLSTAIYFMVAGVNNPVVITIFTMISVVDLVEASETPAREGRREVGGGGGGGGENSQKLKKRFFMCFGKCVFQAVWGRAACISITSRSA